MLREEVGEIFVKFWGLIAAADADAAAVAVAVAVRNTDESIVEVDIGLSLVACLWVEEAREIAEVANLVVNVGI
jgi:hypothetical protein